MSALTSGSEIDSLEQPAKPEPQEGSGGGLGVPKDARAVANFIIAKAREKEKTLTPMQLIKLVYLAHGWFLAWHNGLLIGDDVQAWQYGPVIRSVYDAFKKYGRNPIERPTYGEYDMVIDIGLVDLDAKNDLLKPEPISERFSEEESEVIEEIYHAYGHLSGAQLSALTHQEGSPWHQTYSPDERDKVIKSDTIKNHFKKLDQRNQDLLAEGG